MIVAMKSCAARSGCRLNRRSFFVVAKSCNHIALSIIKTGEVGLQLARIVI